MSVPARRQDFGQLGPAMQALPNERWRNYVQFYFEEIAKRPSSEEYGAQAEAARRAGFGTSKSKPIHIARVASRIMHDERMIAALEEYRQRILRSTVLSRTVKRLQGLLDDPEHKDHGRAVMWCAERILPFVSHQTIEVTHKHVDPDTEALEELRALRQLGTSREKLLELYGGNGLARLERLETADLERRSDKAKVIEGEAIEVVADNEKETVDAPST